MGFTIALQFVFALVVTAVCALFGVKAMWSAMVGSLIAILPNAIFAIYLFASSKPAVYRFFVGEGIKVVIALVAAVIFLAAIRRASPTFCLLGGIDSGIKGA